MSRRANATGRSTARLAGEGQFFPMFERVMASPAWRHLSNDGKALYVEFRRLAMRDKTDSNRINMSCSQASELIGVCRNRAWAVLHELQDHGFIAVAEASSFSTKDARATVYRITHMGPKDDRTEEFRSWEPPAKTKSRYHEKVPSGTTRRDRDAKTVPREGTDGTTGRDRDAGSAPSHGTIRWYTSRSSHPRSAGDLTTNGDSVVCQSILARLNLDRRGAGLDPGYPTPPTIH